jgi:hypothetical protein
MATTAAGASPKSAFELVFEPIISVFKGGTRTLAIIIMILIFGIFFTIGLRYAQVKYQSGQVASTVQHGEVTATEALGTSFTRATDWVSCLFDNSCVKQFNLLAESAVVESNSENQDLGIKILELKPLRSFYTPNSEILVTGRVKAKALDNALKVQGFCYLDGYHSGEPVPAEFLGLSAQGNEIEIYPEQASEFLVNCNFKEGLATTAQIESKSVKLLLTYEFTTKSYQRLWAMPRDALLDLERQGINPFELYSVKDPLLSSDRKLKSKTTPGPINLGLAIDFQQPLTTGAKYALFVRVARQKYEGNLQKIESLKIAVPAVQDLELVLGGEQEIGTCDFDYAGQTQEGYKEYTLNANKLAETNQDCSEASLRSLAVSESTCISLIKEPTYFCSFSLQNAPPTLQSDVITAEANYIYQTEKKTVVDIRQPPQLTA